MAGVKGTATDTRTKLDDARYWVGRLRRIRHNPVHFRRTLDAFLAAARSVTYFMYSEHKGVFGFIEWANQERDRFKQDNIVAFLYEARIRAIHREYGKQTKRPAQTHAQINLTATDYLTVTDNPAMTPIYADGTVGPTMTSPPPEPAPPRESEVTIERVRVFDEFPDTDVVTLCAHLVAKLEDMVAACEARFTPQP